MTATIFFVLRILLSICLYLIILFIFVFLWNESKKTGISILQRRVPQLSISAEDSKKTSTNKIFLIEEVNIGRSPSCELHLKDKTVSNFHARFMYHHKQWWVEDLKSKNGTLINGQNLTSPTVITTGDKISIGEYHLQVSISGDRSSGEIDSNNKHNGVIND
ncbi:FHA domain-containing protein [Chloroflexota bacterium]